MEDAVLYNERYIRWSMFIDENEAEIYEEKALLNANRWGIYTIEKNH